LGFNGRSWENLGKSLGKKGANHGERRGNLGLNWGSSLHTGTDPGIQYHLVTSTKTFPTSQKKKSENRLDIIEAKIPNVHPFGHDLPWIFFVGQGRQHFLRTPGGLRPTQFMVPWSGTTEPYTDHDWGWSKNDP
jgi:hypothetical protein